MYLTYTIKDSVRDTSLSRVCGLKSYYYKLILFKLLQILHLLGVGLLLTFDLLACVDSIGMLYHNSAKFCAKVLHMHILYMNSGADLGRVHWVEPPFLLIHSTYWFFVTPSSV